MSEVRANNQRWHKGLMDYLRTAHRDDFSMPERKRMLQFYKKKRLYRTFGPCRTLESSEILNGASIFCDWPSPQVSNSSPGGPLCLLVFWLFSAPLLHSSHWLAKEWTHLGLQALIDSWLKGNHKTLQTLGPLGIQFDTPDLACLFSYTDN